jgi:hypothetical protein
VHEWRKREVKEGAKNWIIDHAINRVSMSKKMAVFDVK